MHKMVLLGFFSILCVMLVFLQVGCTPSRYILKKGRSSATPQEAVQNAENYLRYHASWRVDCSHFILACYHFAKMNRALERIRGNYNLVRDLNIYLSERGGRRVHVSDIRPGDILIFNATYDINQDGHINNQDRFTHTGIVESYQNGLVTYIDASENRRPPRIHRRCFSFVNPKYNPTVAIDPATGRKIHALQTFYAAYAVR